jgi:hypothetical protein
LLIYSGAIGSDRAVFFSVSRHFFTVRFPGEGKSFVTRLE